METRFVRLHRQCRDTCSKPLLRLQLPSTLVPQIENTSALACSSQCLAYCLEFVVSGVHFHPSRPLPSPSVLLSLAGRLSSPVSRLPSPPLRFSLPLGRLPSSPVPSSAFREASLALRLASSALLSASALRAASGFPVEALSLALSYSLRFSGLLRTSLARMRALVFSSASWEPGFMSG